MDHPYVSRCPFLHHTIVRAASLRVCTVTYVVARQCGGTGGSGERVRYARDRTDRNSTLAEANAAMRWLTYTNTNRH
jgi:hypothetical protein